VLGLIEPEGAAGGQGDLHQASPPFLSHGTACDALRLQSVEECLNVVAHQVELMDGVLFGRMHGDFRRRQREDQPAVTQIDVSKLEDIAQEGAIETRVRAVDDCVRASDLHGVGIVPQDGASVSAEIS
jgi:hypothetical protein